MVELLLALLEPPVARGVGAVYEGRTRDERRDDRLKQQGRHGLYAYVITCDEMGVMR